MSKIKNVHTELQPIKHYKNKVFRFSNLKKVMKKIHNGIKIVEVETLQPIYRYYNQFTDTSMKANGNMQVINYQSRFTIHKPTKGANNSLF